MALLLKSKWIVSVACMWLAMSAWGQTEKPAPVTAPSEAGVWTQDTASQEKPAQEKQEQEKPAQHKSSQSPSSPKAPAQQNAPAQSAPAQSVPSQNEPSEENVWTPRQPSQDTSSQTTPAQNVPSQQGVWTPAPSSQNASSENTPENGASQKSPAQPISPSSASSKNEKALPRPAPDNPYPASLVPTVFLKNFAVDQKDIWTAPFKARIQDLNWLAPFAGLTAGLINADAELSSRISTTGTLARNSGKIANGGLALMLAGTGSFYLLGRWNGNDHQRETGILAGEAVLNSFVFDEILKASTPARASYGRHRAGPFLAGDHRQFFLRFQSLHHGVVRSHGAGA